jgi:hypothetical protein
MLNVLLVVLLLYYYSNIFNSNHNMTKWFPGHVHFHPCLTDSAVFWNVTPFNMVDGNQRSRLCRKMQQVHLNTMYTCITLCCITTCTCNFNEFSFSPFPTWTNNSVCSFPTSYYKQLTSIIVLCFVDHASQCISIVKPTWCTFYSVY